MNCKYFNYKGASILVLQKGEMVEFYMNYMTSDYFFCVSYKANIEDISESDAIDIFGQYFFAIIRDENVLCSYHQSLMEGFEEVHKEMTK